MVSRATAYRYFPNLNSLLVEAPLHGMVPTPELVFGDHSSDDPEERMDIAENAFHSLIYDNEAQFRALYVALLNGSDSDNATSKGLPVRQNRRTPVIEAALAPARDRFSDKIYQNLCLALASYVGLESLITYRDVLQLTPAKARRVKSWAVRALVRAALEESASRSRTKQKKKAR